jgi:phospholipase C
MFKTTATALAAILLAGAAYAGTPKTIGPIFVIALENHNFQQPKGYTEVRQILHNPAAPFINSLLLRGNPAAEYVTYATNYTNVPPYKGKPTHPSEPNYVWSESGFPGRHNDNDPYPDNIVDKPSLSAELQAAGMTWKSYQEDTDLVSQDGQLTNTVASPDQWTVPLVTFSGTSPLYTNPYNSSHQYEYAAKHNPMVFFTATNGGDNLTPTNPEAKYYAPLQQLAVDLANNTVAQYNWITPDEYNDMHSYLDAGFTYHGVHYVGDQSAIAAGDNFLSQVVPMIEASQAFKDGGTIIIWNDETEGEGSMPGKFSGVEIVISRLAKGNGSSTSAKLDHSSDLRTMQILFNLSPRQGYSWLGGSADAHTLASFFQTGALPQLTMTSVAKK